MRLSSLVFFLLCIVTIHYAVAQEKFEPETITVSTVIRDFWPANTDGSCKKRSDCNPLVGSRCNDENCHRDFERYSGSGTFGAIEDTLDRDGKPVLRPEFVGTNWNSVEEFEQWYRDGPWTIPINIDLNLTNSRGNPNIYSFESSNFYPINRKGFGNWQNSRNYHFTTEFKARFVYRGGEEFTFTGDDDLWVFIDGKLVVDLGGLHSALTKTLKVDELGLNIDASYPFYIFHAERHTVDSNFKAYTSLELFCSYYDHCGVCEGDGQSCCNCPNTDPCIEKRCNITTGDCIDRPISCQDDGDLCTVEYCDSSAGEKFHPSTHCKWYAPDCDDNNACTTDYCHPDDGCRHPNITCPDANACNSATCDPDKGVCQYEEVVCDDYDPCTDDYCDSKDGCLHVPKVCNDMDFCTNDTCVNGECVFIEIDDPRCVGNTTCDIVDCDEVGNCTQTPKNCTTDDPCFNSYCDVFQNGTCVEEPIKCDDGNACTADSCVDGECVFEPIPCPTDDPCFPATCHSQHGCGTSSFVDTCNDYSLCTNEECVVVDGLATCNYTRVSCDDKDECTIDTCTASAGCQHQNTTCDDNNACTIDTCDPGRGCVFTPVALPKTDLCITSYCDPRLGIISSDVVCRPSDRCSCDPTRGCVCTDKNFFENLPTEAKALGAVSITLIVLGAVAGVALLAFGGKKGFDYYNKASAANFTVQDNPMYESSTNNVENPLYEEES